MRARKEKTDYQDLIDGRELLLREIKKNAIFMKLDNDQQKRLLSGEQIFLGGMRAAAVRAAGWREENFIAFYNYLSAHAHAAPMSFLRIRKHKIDFTNPSDVQRGIAAFAMEIAEFCLLRVSMHYLFENSELYSRFDAKELEEFRNELATSTVQTG